MALPSMVEAENFSDHPHTYCLQLYVSHVPLVAFFLWLNSPSWPRPTTHFQGFVITPRGELHGATLHASHHRAH
jgi:hypothetical protein